MQVHELHSPTYTDTAIPTKERSLTLKIKMALIVCLISAWYPNYNQAYWIFPFSWQAVGQICSTNDPSWNLSQCKTVVQQAIDAGAKVFADPITIYLFSVLKKCLSLMNEWMSEWQALFLPEASDYIASSPSETISLARPIETNEFVIGLQDEARKFHLPINVGIHEPADGGERVKNTSIWIDENGHIAQRYQKIHLFDVDIKDGPVLKESAYVLNQYFVPFICNIIVDFLANWICFVTLKGCWAGDGDDTTVRYTSWESWTSNLFRCMTFSRTRFLPRPC